jgi:hypothetical protein
MSVDSVKYTGDGVALMPSATGGLEAPVIAMIAEQGLRVKCRDTLRRR